jgi:hypothetical protein
MCGDNLDYPRYGVDDNRCLDALPDLDRRLCAISLSDAVVLKFDSYYAIFICGDGDLVPRSVLIMRGRLR